MYLSLNYILAAIKKLNNVHPFIGITFLSCKRNHLPVGKTMEYPMDQKNKEFMDEVQKIIPNSAWYYQPYKSNAFVKKWVKEDYASSGLQSINTRSFQRCFIHESNSKIWGWDKNYISEISKKVIKGNKKIPLIDLAIWCFKFEEWDHAITLEEIVQQFISMYQITKQEIEILFTTTISGYPNCLAFQEEVVKAALLANNLEEPPDAKPDEEGTLSFLALDNVGPSDHMEMNLASRLNIITGDNGLGKTFLMDCSWWALTGTWTSNEARPKYNGKKSNIRFSIAGKMQHTKEVSISYDIQNLTWKRNGRQPTIPGLIVYACVDGSYAVWDPSKHYGVNKNRPSVFSGSQVWNGLDGSIEGLIRDWVKWQSSPTKYPFDIFTNVLSVLSPPDIGTLTSGDPIRIPEDTREIPTIVHPYGIVPITNTSAGIRRIVTLAYLIVWAWHEHKISSQFRNVKPDSRIVIMIDEIEAHLHPKWQRTILPALMEVQKVLSEELEIQFILSTHSPLVLASAESAFRQEIDKLFHMKLSLPNQDAILEEVDFIKYGQINAWLTSPIFNLRQARSQEAEVAIEEAKILQMTDNPDYEAVFHTHEKLLNCLAENDIFWPRWIYFAEQHGVEI
ncbi:ATP-binding protein [bacterium 1XD42-8]|jgi:predicted ATPase|nr:ATP-binding protein [Lachnospiraceae bacterium]RKJ50452.1 ATP-binding protein [bacterium 1XD42-8]